MMIVARSDNDLAASVSVNPVEAKEKRRERPRDHTGKKRTDDHTAAAESSMKTKENAKTERREKPVRQGASDHGDGGGGGDVVVADKNKERRHQKDGGGVSSAKRASSADDIFALNALNIATPTSKKKVAVVGGEMESLRLRNSFNASASSDEKNKKEPPQRSKSMGTSATPTVTKKSDGGELRKEKNNKSESDFLSTPKPTKSKRFVPEPSSSCGASSSAAEAASSATIKSPVKRMSNFLLRTGPPGQKWSPPLLANAFNSNDKMERPLRRASCVDQTTTTPPHSAHDRTMERPLRRSSGAVVSLTPIPNDKMTEQRQTRRFSGVVAGAIPTTPPYPTDKALDRPVRRFSSAVSQPSPSPNDKTTERRIRRLSGVASYAAPKTAPMSDGDKNSKVVRGSPRRKSDPIVTRDQLGLLELGKNIKAKPPMGPLLEDETNNASPIPACSLETDKARRRKARKDSNTSGNSGYGSSEDDDDVDIDAKRKLWRKGKRHQREMGLSDDEGESIGPLATFLKPDQQKTSQSGDAEKTVCAENKSGSTQSSVASGQSSPGEENSLQQDTSKAPATTKKYKQKDFTITDDILQIALVDCKGPHIVKAKAQHKKGWKRYKAITLNNLEEYIIRETKRSVYGGRVDIRGGEPTGFFHVKQMNQRWTFVDPEGYLFTSVGINSVTAQQDEGVDSAAFASAFTTTSEWATGSHDYLITQLGFNTLGYWSDHQVFQKAGIRIPYCPRWSFMQSYCKKRKYGKVKLSDGSPLPCFDPEFEVFCDEQAKALLEMCNDPWILGHFSDNEIPLRETDIISRYLALPETDPGYDAAAQWLAERGITEKKNITAEDNTAFCTEVISRYHRIVSTAIRKYDPNHLFLGTRFHGLTTKQDCTFLACAPWVDVISINYFHTWTPEQETLNRWASLSGRPILISELSAKGEDAPNCDNATGSGFIVPTQKNRAAFYEHFTIGLMRNPHVIGWHWFRYIDKQGSNLGILDTSFKPYGPLASAMQAINSKLYSLSDYLLTAPASIFADEPETTTGE